MAAFEDSEAIFAEAAKDVHVVLAQDTQIVAERFVDVHIVGCSYQDQIAAIAELIGYDGNLHEIMQKMALGKLQSE